MKIKHNKKRKISKEAFRSTILDSEADLVLVMGAGDIGDEVELIKKTLAENL